MCEEDHVLLWPDTIGNVWRIEGVLAPRLGGATCAAYHVHSGARVAIDVVRGLPGPDPTALKTLAQEAHALRLIDHPNVLKLLEEGVDRASQRAPHKASQGSAIHFLVTELGPARPLPDVLEESQRARSSDGIENAPAEFTTSAAPMPLAQVMQVGRQLLSTLAAAHRLGLAHGDLGLGHLYVLSDEDSISELGPTKSIRLRSLKAFGPGAALQKAIRDDIYETAALLYELAVSQPPPLAGREGKVALKLPAEMDGKLAQIILRGIGASGGKGYDSVDEMLQEFIVAAPPPIQEISAAALAALTRTTPQARHGYPSNPLLTTIGGRTISGGEGLPGTPPPLPRLSGQHPVLPAPPSLLSTTFTGEMPQRSRLSGELREVSFRDLLEEEKRPEGEETLARSRRRVSASSMKLPALNLPAEHLPDAERQSPKASAHFHPEGAMPLPPIAPGAISSGELASVEPTADLHALPVDFSSAISGSLGLGLAPRVSKSESSLPAVPAQPALPGSSRRSPDPARAVQPAKTASPARPTQPFVLAAPEKRMPREIDPFASTGRSPIPSEVLAVSRRLQAQQGEMVPVHPPLAPLASLPASEAWPISAHQAAATATGASIFSERTLPPIVPIVPIAPPSRRSLWPFLVASLLALFTLLGLLFSRWTS